jgi:hypothetical protein
MATRVRDSRRVLKQLLGWVLSWRLGRVAEWLQQRRQRFCSLFSFWPAHSLLFPVSPSHS